MLQRLNFCSERLKLNNKSQRQLLHSQKISKRPTLKCCRFSLRLIKAWQHRVWQIICQCKTQSIWGMEFPANMLIHHCQTSSPLISRRFSIKTMQLVQLQVVKVLLLCKMDPRIKTIRTSMLQRITRNPIRRTPMVKRIRRTPLVKRLTTNRRVNFKRAPTSMKSNKKSLSKKKIRLRSMLIFLPNNRILLT